VQQRLGRDASPVQAGAAEQVLFDQGDRLAALGGAPRGGVCAGSAAEADEIVGGFSAGHGLFSRKDSAM